MFNLSSKQQRASSGLASIIVLMLSALSCLSAVNQKIVKIDCGLTPEERLLRHIAAKRRVIDVSLTSTPLNFSANQDKNAVKSITLGTLGEGKPKTLVEVLADDKALYFFVTCAENPGMKPQAMKSARDKGKIWRDDCLELWFAPMENNKKLPLLHFIINRAGSIWDARGKDVSFNPDWQSKIERNGSGWRAELVFPWKVFRKSENGTGSRPPFRLIGLDIGRNGPGLKRQSLSGGYGDTDRVVLRFPEAGISAGVKKRKTGESSSVAVSGTSLEIDLSRDYVRPGERWLEVDFKIFPKFGDLKGASLTAALFPVDLDVKLAEAVVSPGRKRGRVFVDMRSPAVRQARLLVNFRERNPRTGNLEVTGGATILLRAERCLKPLSIGRRIPVMVTPPPNGRILPGWPVTFGLPFPAGALWNKNLISFIDEKGDEIPFQSEIAGRWGREGSIKWLRVDALVSSSRIYALINEKPRSPSNAKTIISKQENGEILMNSGVFTYVLGKGKSPVMEIRQNGKAIASARKSRGLYVVDQNGRTASTSAEGETMVIESNGPVAACVRFEGDYRTESNEAIARHITRVKLFAGQPFAQIVHTLIISRSTEQIWFREVGWEFNVVAGANPKALFQLEQGSAKIKEVPFTSKKNKLSLLQDKHYFLGHGENHFDLSLYGENSRRVKILEGNECGDWSALTGDNGGLFIGGRDLARQHPKEFVISSDTINLKLFSDAGGDQLDFRMKTLLKKWDYDNWVAINKKDWRMRSHSPALKKRLENLRSNAVGWAKTHDLFLLPVQAAESRNATVETADLNSRPIYAMADPEWIYHTLAMGPNRPKNPTMFPAAERALDKTIDIWLNQDAKWGEHGFVDYFGGPHIKYGKTGRPTLFRYTLPTYHLRSDFWLLYARSGERRLRYFAAGTNRARIDNAYYHYGKWKGQYRTAVDFQSDVPLYWSSAHGLGGMENEFPDNFLWLYFLTGDRRARECLINYGNALQKVWTPSWAVRQWRVCDLIGYAAGLYELTEDPIYKAIAKLTLNEITDPESEVLLTKRAYDSSTYKNYQDFPFILKAWNVFGFPELRRLCLRLGKSEQQFPYFPLGYTPPAASIGSFLYNQTGDPAQVQSMDAAVRTIGALFTPNAPIREKYRVADSQRTSSIFKLGYMLDPLMKLDDNLTSNVSSWIACRFLSKKTRVVLRKKADESISLHTACGPGLSIEPVKLSHKHPYDLKLVETASRYDGLGKVLIPKDAPGGEYAVNFQKTGTISLFASSKAEMVLYAPGYWKPSPKIQNPPYRYYFRVPKKNRRAGIYFSETAALFKPDGTPFHSGDSTCGWIDLSGSVSGLWSFSPRKPTWVKVRGVSPVFSFNDPKVFFIPAGMGASPAGESLKPKPKNMSNAAFVTGSGGNGDSALNLVGGRVFKISSSNVAKLPVGDGTVEFRFLPYWNGFEKRALRKHYLINSDVMKLYVEGETISLIRTVKGPAGVGQMSFMLGGFPLTDDRWRHVAVTWGKDSCGKLEMNLFIDGNKMNLTRRMRRVPGKERQFVAFGMFALGASSKNTQANGAVDDLRISKVRRYADDFPPPPEETEFRPDRDTAVLYLFNDSFKAE